jgi:hypothetical protein
MSNDNAGVAKTGRNRSINRHKWNYEELFILMLLSTLCIR